MLVKSNNRNFKLIFCMCFFTLNFSNNYFLSCFTKVFFCHCYLVKKYTDC